MMPEKLGLSEIYTKYQANHTHVSTDGHRESVQVLCVKSVLSGREVGVGCDGAV